MLCWGMLRPTGAINNTGQKEKVMATRKGSVGRGGKGACGGTRRKDGSGGGRGNRGTSRQPTKKRK